ncbi:hypothetical protein [Pseudomonas sp. MPB26]
MAIRWSKGLWAGLLLGDAIYQINSVTVGAGLPAMRIGIDTTFKG